MGDLNAAIAWVKTRLEGVSGIGKVHSRVIRVVTEQDITERAVVDGKLNVWIVTSGEAELKDLSDHESPTEQRDSIVIRGFYALSDDETNPSEPVFRTLVNAVLADLNTARKFVTRLGGNVEKAEPPQVRSFGHGTFGPTAVLCHTAEIVLPVATRWIL
jgi:hypothetical protein